MSQPKPLTMPEVDVAIHRLTMRLEEGQLSERAYWQTVRGLINQLAARPPGTRR